MTLIFDQVPARDGHKGTSNFQYDTSKPWAITEVDDPKFGTQAPKVYRFEVRVGDRWSGDVNRPDGELHNRVEMVFYTSVKTPGYPNGIPWHPLEGQNRWEWIEYLIPTSTAFPRTTAGGTYNWENAQTNSADSGKHMIGQRFQALNSGSKITIGSSIAIPVSAVQRGVWMAVKINTLYSLDPAKGYHQVWYSFDGGPWIAGAKVSGVTMPANKDGSYPASGQHRKFGLYRREPPIDGAADNTAVLYIAGYRYADSEADVDIRRTLLYAGGGGGGGGGGGPTVPTVTADPATSVTTTSATLNGHVNPNGAASTYQFEWGTDGVNFPNLTPAPAGSIASGTTSVAVSAALTGLTPGTAVFYRLAASNSAGLTRSATASLTTSAADVPDGSTLLETFDVSPTLTGNVIAGTGDVNGGALSLTTTAATPRSEWQTNQYRGIGRRYYSVAPLGGFQSGTGEFTHSVAVRIDAVTRVVAQRYVNTLQTPQVDVLRLRVVEQQADGSVNDLENSTFPTPRAAGVPAGGASTVRALAVDLLGDGKSWLGVYSLDATEATVDTTATWKSITQAPRSFARSPALSSGTPYTVSVATALMSGAGLPTVVQSLQIGGSLRTQAGVDLTAANTAVGFDAGEYLVANLPGGATGQTPPVPKAGYTPERQVFTTPVLGSAQTVTPATGQASGNYRLDLVTCNIGSSPSDAALAMLTRTYESNGWALLAQGVNGDVAAWLFGKRLSASETSPTISHSDSAASIAVLKQLYTGTDTTTPVDLANGVTVAAMTTASLTHPSTQVTASGDNQLLVSLACYDAATGQTGAGYTPPTVAGASMTEDYDDVTSDASSNLRQASAHATVPGGGYAPAWTQAVGVADTAVVFNVLLRPAPGTGGSGGSAGVQEPLIVATVCKLGTDGKTALWGFSPDNAGTVGRYGFVDVRAGNASTPGWAIFRDAVTGTQGGDPAVTVPLNEPVLVVEQKALSGVIDTHVYVRSQHRWYHSVAPIGPFASGAVIPSSGRFVVGLPASGVSAGWTPPAWIGAVMFAKLLRVLTIAEIEGLVNVAGVMTKFRVQAALAGKINLNGATDDARLYNLTAGTATWADEFGSSNPLTVGAGTISLVTDTGNVPYVTGTDETVTGGTKIGDPSGLAQVGATTINASDATLMDFAVRIDAPSAADLALPGFGFVFYADDPDDPDSIASPLGTSTTVPTTGSPKTLTALNTGPIEVYVVAKSDAAVSSPSAPIIVNPPGGGGTGGGGLPAMTALTGDGPGGIPAVQPGIERLRFVWNPPDPAQLIDEIRIRVWPVGGTRPTVPSYAGLGTVLVDKRYADVTGLIGGQAYNWDIVPARDEV